MAEGDASALRTGAADASPGLSPESPADSPAGPPRPRRLRWALLVLGPLLVLAIGLYLYLAGGRYVSTDNAYVKADKVTISADVAGRVIEVAVHENEAVSAGQLLFRLDPEPYRIALDAAEAQLAIVRNDIEAMRASYRQKLEEIERARADIAFFEREYERQQTLARKSVASQAGLDRARHDLVTARQAAASLRQEAESVLAELGGDPDRPTEEHPRYLAAKARRDAAARDLRHTRVTAPMDGVATNVDSLQPGEYLQIGDAAISLVASDHLWVEANPKETDLTYVEPGQPVTVTVDAYPGHEWHGTVAGLSPATGAEFAVLPPQNATGNWVKIVQRIPLRVRIETTPADGQPRLRAGMSATVEIDTGHARSLSGLVKSAFAWTGLGVGGGTTGQGTTARGTTARGTTAQGTAAQGTAAQGTDPAAGPETGPRS